MQIAGALSRLAALTRNKPTDEDLAVYIEKLEAKLQGDDEERRYRMTAILRGIRDLEDSNDGFFPAWVEVAQSVFKAGDVVRRERQAREQAEGLQRKAIPESVQATNREDVAKMLNTLHASLGVKARAVVRNGEVRIEEGVRPDNVVNLEKLATP